VKPKMISMLAAAWCFAAAGAQSEASQPHFIVRLGRRTSPAMGARFFHPSAQQATAPASAPKPEEQPRALEPNKPIVRDMAGGQTHTYLIQLDRGQFLHVAVDQRGIDVVVFLRNPDDATVAEIDSPSGTTGIEPLFWVANSAGTYQVVVRALEKDAPAGKYEIKMDPPRSPTPQDAVRVQAQTAFMEGRAQAAKSREGGLLTAKLRFKDSLDGWQAVGDRERAQQTMLLLDSVCEGLANLYIQRRNDSEAFHIAQERYEFDANFYGPNSINVVPSMRLIASIIESRGGLAEAEKIRKDVITIAQKAKGAESFEEGTSLADLAQFYARQNKPVDAEALFKRALAISEKAEGPQHKDVAGVLVQLAEFYRAQKRYADAEQAYKRAVAIYDKLSKPDPVEAIVLTRLARNDVAQSRNAEAEELDKRAVAISEKALGPDDPNLAESLMELATVYVAGKKYSEAEAADQRALAIYDKTQGPASLNTARAVIALLGVYSLEAKPAEADSLMQRIQTLASRSAETLKWLRGGTAQKDGVGFQYALGALYEKGQGAKQDYAEARKWYGMAAENGATLACVSLARLHENGLGVPKDNVEAYKWYSLAGTGPADWDEHKKQLVAQLSKDQLNDAQRRVGEWQKLHPSKP
jgi:TPR repeat protein